MNFIRVILNRHFPEQIAKSVYSLNALVDMKGAVFDVPDEHVKEFNKIIAEKINVSKKDLNIKLYRCEEMPKLSESVP